MTTTGRVTALIPALNEEDRIGTLVAALCALGFETLVVDDGSTDDTARRAREAGAEVLRYDVNRGKGAAIRGGIERFLRSDSKALVMLDSDGQHDPAEATAFLAELEKGAEFVVGNRMHDRRSMPAVRRWTNRTMSALLSAIGRQHVPDTQCGYRAVTRDAAAKLKLHSDRFEIESEMLLEAARRGIVVRSIPIRCIYAGEKSHISALRDTLRFFAFLLRRAVLH